MANLDAAFGLRPVRHANGQPYTGGGNMYYVPSTYGSNIFVGDPVIAVTDDADAAGIQRVTLATAGATNYALGVVVGVANAGDPAVPVTRDQPVYHQASTAGYVIVADDPDMLFECQEDGVGGAMGVGAVGRNVDLVAGTGSTVTGQSAWELDSNTLGTTNNLQMRIVAPVERTDNDPALTNARWLVKFNLHSLRNLTGV